MIGVLLYPDLVEELFQFDLSQSTHTVDFNVKQIESEDNNNQRKILQIELANEEVKADGSNNTAKDIVWRFFAIENECYVAITGSVGNLPKVHNMDIQFAQSMVFTPCDFAFPASGIKAEATTNTEMILIADVDIDLLRELNQFGSVRNLKDRRKDLFELKKK